MIKLHLPDVANMTSPVRCLLIHVPKTLVVLPDNVKEEISDIGRLSLSFLNSNKFLCGLSREPGAIIVSTRALEVLWVTSYVAGIYYDIVRQRGGLTRSVEIDPFEHPQLLRAMELYGWLINAWLDVQAPQAWPKDFPQPSPQNPANSWEAYASECTLHGTGYLLLHEIAHVARQHGPNDDSGWSIEQEKEADRQAMDWLLSDHPDSASSARIKRCTSVALALVAQLAAAFFNGEMGGTTHPPRWQRLEQIIRYIEDDPAHPVFAFLAQVLPFFRSMSGGQFSGSAYDNYLHAFDGFIDELSRSFVPKER